GVFTGTGPMYRGIRFRLGPTAVLRIGGVRVVVCSNRAQAGDRSILRHVGLEPAAQKIIGLKSSVHFRADYEPIAGKILVVVAPGSNTADTREIPYRRLRPGLRIAPSSQVLSGAPA
ncbi:MAG: microcystin degradation protein MlrC, partial [Alphaproteobacteria bacterium]|nr:microcystin degradation protein MlrC [Alphaproteobacteria bacterium]